MQLKGPSGGEIRNRYVWGLVWAWAELENLVSQVSCGQLRRHLVLFVAAMSELVARRDQAVLIQCLLVAREGQRQLEVRGVLCPSPDSRTWMLRVYTRFSPTKGR